MQVADRLGAAAGVLCSGDPPGCARVHCLKERVALFVQQLPFRGKGDPCMAHGMSGKGLAGRRYARICNPGVEAWVMDRLGAGVGARDKGWRQAELVEAFFRCGWGRRFDRLSAPGGGLLRSSQ